MDTRRDILLTGASGYVGGRLLRALEARGHTVRCLARHPEFVAARAAPGTAVVRGDCLDADSLRGVCDGIGTVYYLVHSMASPGDFAARERVAARNLGDAARVAGVRRIIYLGGLGDRDHLSQHLRSRHETGAVPRASGVPVVGDAIDCWRVEAYEPDARLRLASEMKLPGRAWLEFEVEPRGGVGSTIRQTAVIEPTGLLGLCYWYGIYPFHARLFGGMLRAIAERAGASRPACASPGAARSGAFPRG